MFIYLKLNTITSRKVVSRANNEHSLLDPNDIDITDNKIEVEFFENNTKLGEIIRHPTFGEKTNPFNYSSSCVK